MNPNAIYQSITDIAAWAWGASLAVAIPALVLIALGRWTSFPAKARWWLGAAVVIRLLLPAVPSLPGVHVEWMSRALASLPAQRNTQPAELMAQVEAREPSISAGPRKHIELASYLPMSWMFGTLAVMTWIGVSHTIIRRRISASGRRCRETRTQNHLQWAADRMGIKKAPLLTEMEGLPTVAVFGWLRPRLMVPTDLHERFTADEVRGIFLHELAHLRRQDVLWTWLELLACALHWFNPLVWLAVRRFRADRELECDRHALAHLTDTQRLSFGEALIKTLEAHQWPTGAAVAPFAQHQPEIRTRILMITRPFTARWKRIISFIAVPALALMTLTKVAADGEKEPGKAKEGEGTKTGARDGEGTKKSGARDGEGVTKPGLRDGEGTKKTGARDGEGSRKAGSRDGEGMKKSGTREGEGGKKASAEGGAPRKGAETATSNGNTVVLRVLGAGESVSVDGKSMPANELRAYLSEYLPEHKGSAVVIEADDSAPSRSVAEVLDAARDNGAKKATVRSK
jgi:beta-lactamase regulating signal transducer with metallopeptidase domain